ncbi:hypothetical protein EDB89DRAFT_1971846 [Lactarius sanguifluus]|nr:hypothetical protein EDB89DRAFT_1971846 [Lactarius sanguifluus]
MVAFPPSPSGSRLAAGGRGSLTSLCASCAPHGAAWSSVKAHVRSFSLASPFAVLAAGTGNNNNSTTTAGDHPAATASAGSTAAGARPHVLAIVLGAVGGVIALAVVLALVYVLRVRRKVERFRRSMNVLGPELTPLPRPPDIDVRLANGAHLASVPMTYPRLSSTPSVTSSIGTPRGPPRNLTIDVGASRAIQHTSRPSAGLQTPTRSLYEAAVPSPGPTSFLRREPHSAATQRVTFEDSRLTSNEPHSRSFVTSPPPPRRQTIDVGASRATQHTSRSSAGLQTLTPSPYGAAVPPPPRSAAAQRTAFYDSRLTSNEPAS